MILCFFCGSNNIKLQHVFDHMTGEEKCACSDFVCLCVCGHVADEEEVQERKKERKQERNQKRRNKRKIANE